MVFLSELDVCWEKLELSIHIHLSSGRNGKPLHWNPNQNHGWIAAKKERMFFLPKKWKKTSNPEKLGEKVEERERFSDDEWDRFSFQIHYYPHTLPDQWTIRLIHWVAPLTLVHPENLDSNPSPSPFTRDALQPNSIWLLSFCCDFFDLFLYVFFSATNFYRSLGPMWK